MSDLLADPDLADATTAAARIKALEGDGDGLAAFDLAQRALLRFHGNKQISYLAVRALARGGSAGTALDYYTRFGLDAVADEDTAALNARLLKDLALHAHGRHRLRLLIDAAEAYATVFERFPNSYYTAINAATLNLLARRLGRATALAEKAARLAESERPDTPLKEYWRLATLAEAALVRGQSDAAMRLLEAAVALRVAKFADLASTRRQLQLVSAAARAPADGLDLLRPPDVLIYLGHMAGADGKIRGESVEAVGRRIAGFVRGRMFAAAYGALASGSDILFAEACLEKGIQLNVVLPFPEPEFIATSVRRAGEPWVNRFAACLAKAKQHGRVVYATEDSYLGDDTLFSYGARLAMGLAVLRARQLGTEARLAAVWDGHRAAGAAGTAVDLDFWRDTGREAEVLHVAPAPAAKKPVAARKAARPKAHANRAPRRPHALIFGDVAGFGKLPDASLPAFHKHFMGKLARVIDGFGEGALYRNSWGDGIYTVLADATMGARCALALQAATRSDRWARLGLPHTLSLRLGVHYGPVYEGFDYIQNSRTFYGAHVTRTARLEPVTPAGEVYVTDAMAAALAIANTAGLSCDYVGTMPAAKNYGSFPMYVLRKNRAA
jgi:hypothetical protein